MSTTAPRVESDLGWALGRIVRAHLRVTEEVTAGLPGGHRGYIVLAAACDDGEPLNQLALGRKIGVDRTVLTYLLDELEAAGLVRRRPDPADRRSRQVVVTDEGRARLCAVMKALGQAEEHLLGALAPAERASLREMLGRLAAGSDPTTPCEVARIAAEGC